ncbi:MAG: FimV/HubP family polar landmark protein [Succinivibrio sp.]
MRRFRKGSLIAGLTLLLPLCALSADDDGTFTITIQGPEVETVQEQTQRPARRQRAQTAASPRAAVTESLQPARSNTTPANSATRRAATANTPAVTANTPAAAPATSATAVQNVNSTGSRTYQIRQGDTIWSVAHRYLPADRSLNEFQIVAAIYRNNPNAFSGGNVNNLLKTSIVIPDNSVIAREKTETGSRLLKQGVMTMPPLDAAPASGTVAPESGKETASNAVQSQTIPEYTATETKIRELQKQRQDEDQTHVTESSVPKQDQIRQDRQDKISANTPKDAGKESTFEQIVKVTPNMSPELAVDTKAIKIMLEGNKDAIDQKIRGMEQQLAEALDRMKKSSAATAKTSADSVATLANQYDHIIANIQQDLISIKGDINKMSQDNDRMREMLLANDEKIEDIQLQLSQYSIAPADNSIDMSHSVMMILFGVGILSLVVLIFFAIMKAKARSRANNIFNDDFDIMDSDSADDNMLLSDANGSVEIEKVEGLDLEDESSETEKQGTNANAIDSASDLIKPSSNTQESSPDAGNTENQEKSEDEKAQEAWDNAAQTEAESDESKAESSEDVAAAWDAAMNEQQEQEKEVEIENKDSSQEDLAASWAAATGTDTEEENTDTSESKDPQEDMAAAWAAATGTDTDEEKSDASESKDPQEDMAAAWAAATGTDTGDASSDVNESEDPQEDMAAAWAAATGTDIGDETSQTNESKDPLDEMGVATGTIDESSNGDAKRDEDPQESSVADDLAESLASATDDTAKEESELSEVKEKNVDVEAEEDLASAWGSGDDSGFDDLERDDIPSGEVEAMAAGMAKAMASDDEASDLVNPEELKVELTENESDPEALADPVADPDIDELNDALSDVHEEQARKDEAFDELSGEEKALLESMNQGTEPLETADVTEDQEGFENSVFDADVNENTTVETQTVEPEVISDNRPAVGGNVDEVLNDDLNLEELLTENTETTEELTEADADEPLDTAEDLTEITDAEDTVAETDVTDDNTPSSDELSDDATLDTTGTEDTADDTDTVSWDTDVADTEEYSSSASELAELETRLGSAANMIDTEADADILNMLSGNVSRLESTQHANEEKAFSENEMSRILSQGVAEDEIESDPIADGNVEAPEVVHEENDLEQVVKNVGPISTLDEFDEDEIKVDSAQSPLNPKEHQYYVDELNLARLYFETGDTEEAIKIIDDVREHGSDDLKKEAEKILKNYGN